MANEQRGEVEIFLDKKRIFRFTTNSIVNLEEALGFSITKFAEEDLGVTSLMRFVWAALLHEIPRLTFEEAGDLMDYGNFADISEKVMKALTLYFPKMDEEPKKTKSGLNGTGKN